VWKQSQSPQVTAVSVIQDKYICKAVKIRIYKAMVPPVVVLGGETWVVSEMGMKTMGTWEGEIFTLLQATKAQRWSRGIALLFL
jgi:hypothetical protein